jgi:multidrug resistance efflux pump
VPNKPASIFRPEAVEHSRSEAVPGGLLRLTPPWTVGLYLSLMVVLLAGVATAISGTVRMYSSGRGVMESEARVLSVRAPLAGIVERLDVREGDTVRQGEALLVFDDKAMRTDPDRVNLPWNVQILQQQRLTLQADGAGVVDRLLVRPGSYVNAGDLVATIVPVDERLFGYVLLPARDWPYLHAGDPIALKFDAYPWQEMGVGWGRVERVGADAGTPEADGRMGSAAGTVRVRVSVERMPDGAAGAPVLNGMGFTGEVALRTARIYELLLKPFALTPGPPAAR